MAVKSKKSKLLFYLINFLIVILVSGLAIYKMAKENGLDAFTYLKELSVLSILILTLMFFINYYLEGIAISVSMKDYKEDFTPQHGFVIQCVGGLFSAITPLKIGYYPSLAYAYSKFKVKAEQVIKSMAKTSFSYQLICLIICVISIIICFSKELIVELGSVSLNLKYVALIGLVYNGALMIGYFILILSPRFHKFLIKCLTWFLFKIKRVKDKEEYYKTKIEKMALIREEIKRYFKNYKQSILIFVIYTAKVVISGGLPYVAYLIISKQPFQIELWLFTVILGHLISYITNIIPIPGASGAAEFVFVAVFSLVFTPESLLTSVMLVWRMFSYFMNIIVGFIVFLVMINVKKKEIPIQ